MKETLADFGPRAEEHTSKLLNRIESADGEAILLNEYCMCYSYDVMSALTFGNSMGFVTGQLSDVANHVIKYMEGSFHALGLLFHVP